MSPDNESMVIPERNILSRFPKYSPSPLKAKEYPATNQIIEAIHAIMKHCARVDKVFLDPTSPA